MNLTRSIRRGILQPPIETKASSESTNHVRENITQENQLEEPDEQEQGLTESQPETEQELCETNIEPTSQIPDITETNSVPVKTRDQFFSKIQTDSSDIKELQELSDEERDIKDEHTSEINLKGAIETSTSSQIGEYESRAAIINDESIREAKQNQELESVASNDEAGKGIGTNDIIDTAASKNFVENLEQEDDQKKLRIITEAPEHAMDEDEIPITKISPDSETSIEYKGPQELGLQTLSTEENAHSKASTIEALPESRALKDINEEQTPQKGSLEKPDQVEEEQPKNTEKGYADDTLSNETEFAEESIDHSENSEIRIEKEATQDQGLNQEADFNADLSQVKSQAHIPEDHEPEDTNEAIEPQVEDISSLGNSRNEINSGNREALTELNEDDVTGISESISNENKEVTSAAADPIESVTDEIDSLLNELKSELEESNVGAQIEELVKEEPVFIFTSLAGGGIHMPRRTNRLATILTANEIEFTYRDCGTDSEARSIWKTYSAGRLLPGVVRGTSLIGNWKEIDDANEEYRLYEMIYNTL